MKLIDILETIPGGIHPIHNDESIEKVSSFLLTGIHLSDIENNSISLFLTNDQYLSIFTKDKPQKLIGWLDYKTENKRTILNKVYVLPKYRLKQYGKLLLFWLKSRTRSPIVIDNVVFNDGENFINSLEKDGRFVLKLYDKTSKMYSEFSKNGYQLKQNISIIIESSYRDFLEDAKLPGSKERISYSYFIL